MSASVEPPSAPPASMADVPAAKRGPSMIRLPGGRSEPVSIFMARIALPLILILLIVTFSVLKPTTFPTVNNLRTVLNLQSVLGILSLGLMLTLIVGELDLSIAANLGFGLILTTGLSSQQGLPLAVAILLAVAACTTVGLVNGLLVTRVGINSLIATLAMSTILTGIIGAYTGGNVFYEGIPPELIQMGQGRLWEIPFPVIFALVLAIAVWYLLDSTPIGRYLYAIGGNPDAARLSGVPVQRLTVAAFAGAGLLAGIGGVVQASILGSGNPTVGPPLLLPAFAACYLGATAIKPGVFNVWGMIIAVITVQVGVTGLAQLGAEFWVEPIFTGLALLIAVAAARVLRGEKL
jgi:ribose transport system permease protein